MRPNLAGLSGRIRSSETHPGRANGAGVLFFLTISDGAFQQKITAPGSAHDIVSPASAADFGT
jgi:hypothetical protein